jgi:hypothetical protein
MYRSAIVMHIGIVFLVGVPATLPGPPTFREAASIFKLVPNLGVVGDVHGCFLNVSFN